MICLSALTLRLEFWCFDLMTGLSALKRTNWYLFLAILRLFDGEFLPPRFILFLTIAKRPLLCSFSFDLRRMLEYLRVRICSR